jgi:hypothetical protein
MFYFPGYSQLINVTSTFLTRHLESMTLSISTKVFLVLTCCTFLSACYDCGPQRELTVTLNISSRDSIKLNKIWAKKDTGLVDLTNYEKGSEPEYRCCGVSLTLPISLIADQTTYFFEFENREDSLTVFYKRDFQYDGRCGFVADIVTSSASPRAVSSFSRTSVSATSYVGGKQKISLGGPYRGGIQIDLVL